MMLWFPKAAHNKPLKCVPAAKKAQLSTTLSNDLFNIYFVRFSSFLMSACSIQFS